MKKFIKKNKDNIILGIVSVIAFIVGCLAAKPLIAFIVIALVDCVLFIPGLLKKRKKVKGRHMSYEKRKDNNTYESKKKKRKRKKLWKTLLLIFFILCIVFILAACAGWAYIVKHSPKFDPNELYHQESTTLYDIDGKEFATLGTEKRELVEYEDLPETLINAIIATEDSRFYQHNGFDLPRFTKATLLTLLGSSSAGGASTLTMQLVKNHYTSVEKSLTRKFTDINLAINKVEKKYSKEEILEFYVNAPYLGAGAYGVEKACQTYFGKSVSDINVSEAAMIAGLFQSPGSLDPTRFPEKTEARRKLVLKLMKHHGYITNEEYEIAKELTVEKILQSKEKINNNSNNEYQVFIDTVIEEMEEDGFDPYAGSYDVYTTMNRKQQEYINDIMNGKTWKWEDSKVTAGIAVVDVKNGGITAIGGGRDKTTERSFNTATQLNNQIGSTAKPLYDYSVGIEYENWSTYEPMTDENISYSDGTELNNWDGSYMGYLTSRRALAESRNTSAVKAFKKNNVANIEKTVKAMGLHPEANLHQAHAIGGYNGEYPVSMAGAYATFGNGGVWNSPHSYTKIVDKNTEITTEKEVVTNKVFSPQTAYIMTSMLQSSAKTGLGAYSNVNGCVFGAKTGTSNFDQKTLAARHMPQSSINDYWVDGVSPDYAISVWYGYEKPNSKYHNSFGTTYHERLFQLVAKGVFKKDSKFKNPGGVSSVTVENHSYPAKLPSQYTPADLKVTELFKSGTEPTETSDRFAKLAAPTGLSGSVSNNTVTLTWNKIETPNAYKDKVLDELASKLFEVKSWQNKFKSSYKGYVGDLIYRVYAKKADGSLEEIKTTKEGSVSFTVDTSSASTYVVKASYSKMTSNMSDGVEVNISMDGVTDNISITLKGEQNITTPKGTYKEADLGATVLINGSSINDKPSISYKTENGNLVTEDYLNNNPGKYIVTYTYKTASATRNVTITA